MTIFRVVFCWCLLCARLSLFLATLSYSFYSIVILKSEVIQRCNKSKKIKRSSKQHTNTRCLYSTLLSVLKVQVMITRQPLSHYYSFVLHNNYNVQVRQ